MPAQATRTVKASDGHGQEWTRRFADADDRDQTDGEKLLDFWTAQDRAKALARGKSREGEPVTVNQALDDYRTEFENEGADPADADRVRPHRSDALAGKCVALLSVRDLRAFRDGLSKKGLAPGGVNRAMKGLRAALNAAAAADPRIANNAAWRIGLASLPVGDTARRMVLLDGDVGRLATASYEIDRPFGLYVEVLAVTGARPSQATRPAAIPMPADRRRGDHEGAQRVAKRNEAAPMTQRDSVSSRCYCALLPQAEFAGAARQELLAFVSPGEGNYAKELVFQQRKRREISMVHTLVPSDRVEAAAVYCRDGDKIGTIERLMLEKVTGTVVYAVVKCGGFLGTCHHYPVPWSALNYNLARKAYETTLTLEALRSGPSELDGEAFDWGDRSPVYRHPQYWTV